MLVPALLTVPTAAPAQAVDANDIEARTSKILVLAAHEKWDEVARYTNAKMLAWLKVHDHRTKAPSCKKSVASRPGDPVYACLYEESRIFSYAVPMKWWIFYRRLEGRWTLVNERIITSASADRVRTNLGARADKIWAFAVAGNWDAVAVYTTPGGLTELKTYVETATGPVDPATSPRACEQVTTPAGYADYGKFNCLLPIIYETDVDHGLAFDDSSGRWLATGIFDTEPIFP
ncbi:hypothetical protein ASD81_04995 [Nocardioides sp. Root614]|nr:hypothetical protein ASD81_04995 [Nocardioides sp. Root614]KRA91994.1 hypothetical protein ASD84_05260 [Nocardioides sp. Root682]